MSIIITQEKFLQRVNDKIGDKYDYSKCVYKSAHEHVTVICRKHGEFKITPNNLIRGRCCPKCRRDENKGPLKYTQEEIIKQCVDIWGDRFDYSDLVYTRKEYKHKIKCNICGEYFYQRLEDHINARKNGCPNCQNDRGWSRSQWIEFCNKKNCHEPIVYIIRLFNDNECFVKIGITSNSIFDRMKKIPYEYEVIREIKGSPLFVYNKEIELHQKFVNSKYTPQKDFKGMYECYDLSILSELQNQ